IPVWSKYSIKDPKAKQWSNIREVSKNTNTFKTMGEVIHQKAFEFAALLEVSESNFKASDSWFSQFKARMEIQNY
ncbi:10681_t:CDS:2, partial [Racocetra persica]